MSNNIDSQTLPAPYINEPRIERDEDGTWHVRGYAEARDLLKEELIQDGFNAEEVRHAGFEGVLYTRGEPHRRMRSAIAKYFSPTTVQQSHLPMIERTMHELIADLKKRKSVDLKVLSRKMATVVASAVVGLNPSAGMIRRLDEMLHSPEMPKNPVLRLFRSIRGNYLRLAFLLLDVMPAISKRRRSPQNDVISYMLSQGKGPLDILVECIVYGAAGMVTTQEFVCVALLHCLEHPEVRAIMESDDKAARYETLNEILRLEPVIAKIYRKSDEPVTLVSEGAEFTIPAHERIAVHIYDSNVDPKAAGPAPTELHPHRDMGKGVYRSMLGFGSGPHRCAGEHLAIAETDVFLHKLLKVPGLRVESGPTILRNETLEGYEIEDMIVAVD